jgi:signal transduction histidine kinase/ActR/RegA family two-component response regulator
VNATVEAGPLRVVIIDDTADLRDLLRLALGRGGMCVVGEAGDGLAGIEAVRAGNPDVVLLDLSMPVMDGLEALPEIRALAPAARIIVLSGFGATQMTERAIEAGADGYLQKGVSLGRILDYIRDMIDSRPIDPAPRSTPAAPSGDVHPTAIGAATQSLVGSDAPPNGVVGWDVLAMAPFGIIELGAEPPYRLVRLNAAAGDLLEYTPMPPGTPLHQICPELTTAIAENRLRGDIDFEASTGVELVQVSLRHSGTSLVAYLHPITDEVGTLRRAIATTAHEIRGPVGVLGAVAETLAITGDSNLDASLLARMMSSVQRQSRMLDSITADLLTAAQIQRGTLRVEPHALDPISLIETLIEDRYPGSVIVQADDRRSVLADPLRLEQMIGNLLSNAHKYGQPPIVLRTKSCPDRPELFCIDVQDNGDGVSPEFQAQLFREFSRATGAAVAGTGLGLHVVRTLAHAQGGTVSYATAPGGGAVFTLTLQAANGAS